jgi:hypothetical protein
MSPLSRRRLLQTGGVAVSIGLAGCSTLGHGGAEIPTQRLGAIDLWNRLEDDVTVSVFIFRGEEAVYWQTHRFAATGTKSDVTDGTIITPPEIESVQMYPPEDEAGHYMIGIYVEETDQRMLLDLTELARTSPDSDGCYLLHIFITEDGPVFGRGTSEEYTNCPS